MLGGKKKRGKVRLPFFRCTYCGRGSRWHISTYRVKEGEGGSYHRVWEDRGEMRRGREGNEGGG